MRYVNDEKVFECYRSVSEGKQLSLLEAALRTFDGEWDDRDESSN